MNPSFHTYITLRMSFIAFECGMPRGSSQPLEFRHSNWAGEAQEFCVNIPFRLYNEREKRNTSMGVHGTDLDPRGGWGKGKLTRHVLRGKLILKKSHGLPRKQGKGNKRHGHTSNRFLNAEGGGCVEEQSGHSLICWGNPPWGR